MERPVVAIITDFGHSEYLAARRAAIQSLSAEPAALVRELRARARGGPG